MGDGGSLCGGHGLGSLLLQPSSMRALYIFLMTTGLITLVYYAETMVGMQFYPSPEILEEPCVLHRRQEVSADGAVAQLVINALVARVD